MYDLTMLAFDLADRSMAELQARRDQPAPMPPAATTVATSDDAQLTSLLQRLDRCLGDDGTLWGGEALLGSAGVWRRVCSLRPFRLPGGERAGREPWRSAAALCWEAGVWQTRIWQIWWSW